MENQKLIEQILSQVRQPLWENWYIQERIGTGAYSAVYKVTAKRMNRTDVSALKIEPIVPDEKVVNDEEKRRKSLEERRELAVNESSIMYSLRSCPNIVSYEDEDIRELVIDGKLEGYYFLIRMECLDCLGDLLKQRKYQLNEKNILRLACDIGRGIKAAHDMGIIHRDLKPGNFFIDKKGVYKLGDFNISKQAESSKAFAGTNSYIAPEVYFSRSSGGSYTSQADIYSFGICLYQLMNDLFMPFESEMPLKEAVEKRMTGIELPPPKRASAEFSRIILRACAFSTENRYAKIDEMLRDLDALEKGVKPAQPEKPSAPKPAPVQPAYQPQQPIQQIPVQPPVQPNQPPVTAAPFAPPPVSPPAPEPQSAKGFNPMPLIAGIAAIAVIGAGSFFAIKYLSKDDKPVESSSVVQTTTEQASSAHPITSISVNTSEVTINVSEDITIIDVDCPDIIKMDEPKEMFGFSYSSDIKAKSTDLVVTVNSDANEQLCVDTSSGLDIKADKVDNQYYFTIDASDAADKERELPIIIRNKDKSVSKKVIVVIKRTGPFHDEVKKISDSPEVITFTSDGKYTLHSPGEAVISWIYGDEKKFTKKIKVEK